MKKKTSPKKLDLNKKIVGTLSNPAAINGGLRQVQEAGGDPKTYELTGCGMTCWSYGNYCFLSENCA